MSTPLRCSPGRLFFFIWYTHSQCIDRNAGALAFHLAHRWRICMHAHRQPARFPRYYPPRERARLHRFRISGGGLEGWCRHHSEPAQSRPVNFRRANCARLCVCVCGFGIFRNSISYQLSYALLCPGITSAERYSRRAHAFSKRHSDTRGPLAKTQMRFIDPDCMQQHRCLRWPWNILRLDHIVDRPNAAAVMRVRRTAQRVMIWFPGENYRPPVRQRRQGGRGSTAVITHCAMWVDD